MGNLKNLYIIAGCNGAGKTTAAYNILLQILNCKEFVNADEIAKGISPLCRTYTIWNIVHFAICFLLHSVF
jgi:predicted ABC-type ATPase